MTDERRVLICGGRGWGRVAMYLEGEDREARIAQAEIERVFLFTAMDDMDAQFGPFTHVIHGDAPGADKIGGQWAEARGKVVLACPAEWDKHGKGAGPIRNQAMLDQHHPDVLVAFEGGKGTLDMLKRALKTETVVIQYQPKGKTAWEPIRLKPPQT